MCSLGIGLGAAVPTVGVPSTFPQLPALVEGVYLDTVVCVLLEDLLGVLVSIEGVHEDQGYVCVVGLVQVLRKRDWNRLNTNLDANQFY